MFLGGACFRFVHLWLLFLFSFSVVLVFCGFLFVCLFVFMGGMFCLFAS